MKTMNKYDKIFAKESLKTIVAHFCDDIYDNYRIVNAVLDVTAEPLLQQ